MFIYICSICSLYRYSNYCELIVDDEYDQSSEDDDDDDDNDVGLAVTAASALSSRPQTQHHYDSMEADSKAKSGHHRTENSDYYESK